jgi:crotonobetainyl-CoA:carnitine CoA-transferase CaiB-like acyl-CoA transferase
VRHRDLHLTLRDTGGLKAPSLRSPLRFSVTPVEHVAPPQLGEHTHAVLSAELSLPAERIEDLRKIGVLAVAERP